ncbi:uncharacterized protein LOC114792493 [Denticeps clupeoides]|uniref:uncharacterized protein LOC114792493 n=1 Tax=Denticeps clupeoides TaxID=299321 RepID=UPI0010A43CED|nr:uncharacterized protein LOC114792493 [Denticeps clupeoides]XP_028840763.1 uncharacterized protein LOC114792493 [Denticeps clupeoides]
MKAHEGELLREISKLQGIVTELKAGFSRALVELSHIQHGDRHLQNQLQDAQNCCHKRALHLEALVQSLREELGEVRDQIHQLCGNRIKPDHEKKAPETDESGTLGSRVTQRDRVERCQCNGSAGSALRASLLLHCYLQGLRAVLCQSSDASLNGQVVPKCVRVPQTVIGSWPAEVPRPCSLEGKRQQVTVQLLQSEWEYVSSLGQLYDKYKTLPTLRNQLDQHKVFLKHVEQLLQCHLVFRNALEERLAADQWRCLVGDVFAKLTCHNEAGFSEAYLGYMSSLPGILSTEISRIKPSTKPQNAQGCQEDGAGLITLLFSPVSRIHSYLSVIQNLLDWTGGDHPDRHLLLDAQRLLGHIRSRFHMILEQSVRLEENEVSTLRCEIPSPDCPSAFTKYTPISRNSHAHTHTHNHTICHEHREERQPATTQVAPDLATLSRCTRVCRPVPAAGGSATWAPPPDGREKGGDVRFLLHRAEAGGNAAADIDPGQGTSACALNMCPHEIYHMNRHLLDFETDAEDLGDTSVFDYSSVTSCSPDDTLDQQSHGRGGEESREDEEEEEEDSQIPVLLKPSYTHPRLQSNAPRTHSHREGTVCTRWQIPRAAQDPAAHTHLQRVLEFGGGERVCLAAGASEARQGAVKMQRQLSRAFRPIWDQPYRQADETPAKDQSQRTAVPQVHPGPSMQHDREGRRSFSGTQGNGDVWNESEDSEGPCSNV